MRARRPSLRYFHTVKSLETKYKWFLFAKILPIIPTLVGIREFKIHEYPLKNASVFQFPMSVYGLEYG